jgi:hypothetical protein
VTNKKIAVSKTQAMKLPTILVVRDRKQSTRALSARYPGLPQLYLGQNPLSGLGGAGSRRLERYDG